MSLDYHLHLPAAGAARLPREGGDAIYFQVNLSSVVWSMHIWNLAQGL